MTGFRIWVGLALGLVLAFAIVAWMGRRLPVEHHVVASGRVEASQDVVWTLVFEAQRQQTWRKGVSRISLLPGKPRCWMEFHAGMSPVFCEVKVVPKERLVVWMASDPEKFGGTWTYALSPLGPNATQVTVTEDGYVQAPLWRFVGHYLIGNQTNTQQYLKDLQAEAPRKR